MTGGIEVLRRRLRFGTLPEALLQPGRDVVLRAGDRSITRDELRERAGEVAGGLHDLGLSPGDRVALFAANSLDWVTAYLGAQRAGACVVLMNPDYHSAEAEHILRDSEPALVIADKARAAVVEPLGARVVLRHDDEVGLSERLIVGAVDFEGGNSELRLQVLHVLQRLLHAADLNIQRGSATSNTAPRSENSSCRR